MLGFWPIIFVFLVDSVHGDLVESNAGSLSPFCKYAEAFVGAVAPRPLPEETSVGLKAENFGEEETWKPYLAPWATAVAIIVILPLLFVLVYLVYRCIASCLTSDSKPKRKIGLKNVLNALLLILAVFVIAFAAIAAYGIIQATSSANRMGNVVESFANETDHYVQDNCAALKNMIGVETNVTSVMPRISKSFHEAVADMKHKLAVKHVPVIEKIHMTVLKIRTRQKDIGELLALLPILRTRIPGLADTIQPLVPYLQKMREFREVTPRDTYKQKVDTMFENIVAVGDERLNEIAPQIQTKIDEKLKNQLSGVCGEADQLTQPLKELRNGYEQQVKPHIVYPYYAVLATAAVLLGVACISLTGIGYSCIVTNRSADHEGSKCFGPKSLYNFSIGAVLLLLITVPLLTAALFAPLGVATDLVCDPWKNPEKRSDVLSVLDSLAARALKDAANSADEAVEGILAKLEYPVSKIVNECANETSLLQILKLGEVSDLLRAGQKGQSGGPLASYLDELNKTILDSWPKNAVYNQSYFDILKDMRAMAASPIPEEQLQNLESFAPREHRKHFRTIRWIVAFRKELPSILPTEEEVQDFLDSLTPAELMELVKPSVDKLLDDAKHYTMEFADTFIATVEKRAGNCGELKRIVVDLRTEVCDNTIDIYNTVWLSFLHIIVILIPFVVIGGALGRLH